ncbi:MAG: ribosome silencing factor [bacterium]
MKNKTIKTLINKIMKASNDKKAENVCCYDLNDKGWITEYVILISAKNTIHCKALFDEIEKISKIEIKKTNTNDLYESPKKTGKTESGWVIVDLNSIICHCITKELRENYELDKLMSEKTNTIYY